MNEMLMVQDRVDRSPFGHLQRRESDAARHDYIQVSETRFHVQVDATNFYFVVLPFPR